MKPNFFIQKPLLIKLFVCLLFFSFLFSAPSYSKKILYGIKAGVLLEKIDAKKTESTSETAKSLSENSTGITGGGFLRLSIPKFMTEVGLNISSTKSSLADVVKEQAIDIETKKLNLDIPVVVGMNFVKKILNIHAGVLVSTPLSNSSSITGIKESGITSSVANDHNLNFGYIGGIGLNFWKLVVDLRYTGPITDIGKRVLTVTDATGTTGAGNVLEAVSYDDRIGRLFSFTVGFSF